MSVFPFPVRHELLCECCRRRAVPDLPEPYAHYLFDLPEEEVAESERAAAFLNDS